MKFKFPLEKVLQHRKIQEDLAQKDFQEALSELNAEQEKLQSMIMKKSEARRKSFEDQCQGGEKSGALSQAYDFHVGQDIRIERQRQKIRLKEERVEELREILREKAVEYKIIDKLKDKQKQEFRQHQNKKQQKNSDDLTITRFARREKE